MLKRNNTIDSIIIVIGLITVTVLATKMIAPYLPDPLIALPPSPTVVDTHKYTITVGDYVATYIRDERVSVEKFQESLGFTGKDVDGIVGHKTIEAALYLNSLERTDD